MGRGRLSQLDGSAAPGNSYVVIWILSSTSVGFRVFVSCSCSYPLMEGTGNHSVIFSKASCISPKSNWANISNKALSLKSVETGNLMEKEEHDQSQETETETEQRLH